MALNQAFMSNNEHYTPIHEEEENISFSNLKKPLILAVSIVLPLCILVSSIISLNIVFPSEPTERPFCPAPGKKIEMYGEHGGGAFYMTEEEAVDFYWFVAFLPSAVVFLVSVLYLIAGITVAYTAPKRHFLLKLTENNFCASRRGGVRCLSILNAIFALFFSLTALILGSTLLTLKTRCSVPLFFCFEIASWSLVILHGLTSFFLKRKDALLLDGQESNLELEMLDRDNGIDDFTPEMERRVNEGFKQWMGSSVLSSDDEDESPDDYLGLESPV
ncbi:hypothetical protein LUZ60_012578 [Juncus effusus]|nr:hypothetical protein LUZ60_012578 [Juncus effusus]